MTRTGLAQGCRIGPGSGVDTRMDYLMPYPWLCLWDRTLDLPKAQLLSGDTFKGWINLLMIANRFGHGGKLPEIDQVAFGLRIDITSAKSLIESLVKSKLIDRNGSSYVMHDWESWQAHKRSSSERSKEWREHQRALGERSEDDVGERSDERDASARASAQGALASRARGIESQLQNKTEQKNPPTPRKRVVRLVDFSLPDWIPETDWNDWLLMRRAKKAPATPGAMCEAVAALDKLRGDGHDPGAVLRQSTLRAWTGVFPIAVPYTNGQPTEAVPLKKYRTREEQERLDAAAARNANR